jgi:ATP synthase protein I
MIDENGGQSEQADLQARLERLDDALRRVEAERAAPEAAAAAQKGRSHAMRVGLNAVSEFVGAVVVGGLLGWQADSWLGTGPLFLILLLGFGVAAGFYNVYRVARPRAVPDAENLDPDA